MVFELLHHGGFLHESVLFRYNNAELLFIKLYIHVSRLSKRAKPWHFGLLLIVLRANIAIENIFPKYISITTSDDA